MALRDFDRRWIFLAMGVVVVGFYALGYPAPLPVNPYVQRYYDRIDALPPGSIVMLAADFDPASAAEIEPMYRATIHHLLDRDLRVVNVATWPAAPPFTKQLFTEIPSHYGKSYGVDWVEFGFKPGDDVAMGNIAQSLRSAFPSDDRGNPTGSLPLMADVGDSMEGIALLVTMSAGYPGILEWIAQVGGRYNVSILAGTTAVQTPDLYAFYPNQVEGFLGAATGAAQYLQLVNASLEPPPGATETLLQDATDEQLKRMRVQRYGHFLIIGLIVVGNVIYFAGRRRAS